MLGRDMRRTCCFTGHRPEKIPQEMISPLQYRLAEAIERAVGEGYVRFISGMSRGLDFWAAQIVLSLKEEYPQIELEAALPCVGQDRGWPQAEKEEFHRLLGQADIQTCLSQEYTKGCMHTRNRYMVDSSSLLIAFYNGDKTGGTAYTCRYAAKKGIQVINLFEPKNEKQLCLSAELR